VRSGSPRMRANVMKSSSITSSIELRMSSVGRPCKYSASVSAGSGFTISGSNVRNFKSGLLLYGVRTLNGWSWLRSLAALALAGVFVVLFLALAIVA